MNIRLISIISIILFISLILTPYVSDMTKADSPSGGIISGDIVYWENNWARLEVYPHTSVELLTQKQYCNLTWKTTPQEIDVAFRFNFSITGKIWRWNGDSWVQIDMDHLEYNGKHYYYYQGFNVETDTTYRFKWEYQTPINTSGKWDLLAKLSSDSIQDALENDRYVSLDPWWDSNWVLRKLITIDNSYIESDLTDFPVLVNLSSAISINCQSDGDDVRFLGYDNSSVLSYQFDKPFDSSSCNLVWVRLPKVYAANLTHFYVYYNNPLASHGERSTDVWDANYKAVYHFSNNLSDSTSNKNTLSGSQKTSTTAKFGISQKFDGSNALSHATLLEPMPSGITFELWAYHNSSGAPEFMVSKGFSGAGEDISVYFGASQELRGRVDQDTFPDNSKDRIYANQSKWEYVAIAHENGQSPYFHFKSISFTHGLALTRTEGTPNDFYVGIESDGSNYKFIGYIDELRISAITRTHAWLNASYHTQAETSGFITFAGEECGDLVHTNVTTNINTTSATGNGYLGAVGAGDWTCGFWVGTSTPINDANKDFNFTDGDITENTEFIKAFTGLTQGTHYYAKSWVAEVGDDVFYSAGNQRDFWTKPEPPSNLHTSHSDCMVTLSWTKGIGAAKTIIRRGNLSYPGLQNGTLIYNGTGASTTDTSAAGDDAYYRAWSYSTDWTSPNVTALLTDITPCPPSDVNAIVQSNGSLKITWTKGQGAYKTVIVKKTGSYPMSSTDGTVMFNNTVEEYTNESTLYNSYFALFSYSLNSVNMSEGVNAGFGLVSINVYNELYPWLDVDDYTILVSNQAGTETYYQEGCSNPTNISYDDIPFGENTVFHINHADYESRISFYDIYENTFYNLTFYLSPKDIPDEPDCEQRTFIDSVTVTDYSSDLTIALTYDLDELIQVEIYNKSLYGTYGGWIVVPNDKIDYNTTRVIIDQTALDANTTSARVTYYFESCSAGFSPPAIYYIRIVESYETSYGITDRAIEGAKVTFQKYFNTTDSYANISVLFTDADGHVNLYLIPGGDYRVVIEKDGYYTKNASYQPPPPNEFGQTTETTFRIEAIQAEPGDQIIIPMDSLVVSPYNSTTFAIYYVNLNEDNLIVNISLYNETGFSNLIVTYSESDDPNEFTVYFNYTTYGIENGTIKVIATVTRLNGSVFTLIAYINIEQAKHFRQVSYSAPIAAILSVGICLFGLTFAHPKKVLGIVGIITMIIALMITVFVEQTWYIHLFQAIELILLFFVFLVLREENIHAF